MYVIGLHWEIDPDSTASHKWHLSQTAVENRISNEYISCEGFTDADNDE